MSFVPDHWSDIFVVQTPLLELLVRGLVLYAGILVLMRLMPRRTGGQLAMMDLVMVLLVTEAASHALGDYDALGDGLVMVIVIMALNYLVNFLSYHVPAFERLVSSPPLLVIRNGRFLRRNMRSEYLTEEELMSYLRQNGIDDVSAVKAAFVEDEGKVSVIKRADA